MVAFEDFVSCERDCGCGCDYHGHCTHYPEDVCCHCGANPKDEGEEDYNNGGFYG